MGTRVRAFVDQWVARHVLNEPFDIGHSDAVDELVGELLASASAEAGITEREIADEIGDLHMYITSAYGKAQRNP